MNKHAKKILLIEDDALTVEVYKSAFEAGGLKIDSITTAAGALARFKEIRQGKKEKPALILLDLILPDIDGISLLKELKDSPETKDIAVFVLTNYTNPVLTQDLMKQGADKFLVKVNITPTQVVKTAKEALRE